MGQVATGGHDGLAAPTVGDAEMVEGLDICDGEVVGAMVGLSVGDAVVGETVGVAVVGVNVGNCVGDTVGNLVDGAIGQYLRGGSPRSV